MASRVPVERYNSEYYAQRVRNLNSVPVRNAKRARDEVSVPNTDELAARLLKRPRTEVIQRDQPHPDRHLAPVSSHPPAATHKTAIPTTITRYVCNDLNRDQVWLNLSRTRKWIVASYRKEHRLLFLPYALNTQRQKRLFMSSEELFGILDQVDTLHLGYWRQYAALVHLSKETEKYMDANLAWTTANHKTMKLANELLEMHFPEIYNALICNMGEFANKGVWPMIALNKMLMGRYQGWHRDLKDAAWGLCVIFYFGEWTGGRLRIHDLDIDIDVEPGDVIMFDSRLWHAVELVTEGIRYSLVFFIHHTMSTKAGDRQWRHPTHREDHLRQEQLRLLRRNTQALDVETDSDDLELQRAQIPQDIRSTEEEEDVTKLPLVLEDPLIAQEHLQLLFGTRRSSRTRRAPDRLTYGRPTTQSVSPHHPRSSQSASAHHLHSSQSTSPHSLRSSHLPGAPREYDPLPLPSDPGLLSAMRLTPQRGHRNRIKSVFD